MFIEENPQTLKEGEMSDLDTIAHLRAVNAKLLRVLEYTTAFLSGIIEGERIPTGIKASARIQIAAARAVIKETKK
jgi:hypothetical protein